jgi:anionic cell wall polymer biosynthesis LytR-Cps2A-Psr (LCP) family protein
VLSSVAGGICYFMPAAQLAIESTGQVLPTPSPSDLVLSPSPTQNSPSPATPTGAFTVLLLGSDDDSKFTSEHVLTQSMILVRVVPSTKQVTMLSIPRDLYVRLSTGGYGKVMDAYSYGGAGAAIATV